jgi:RNA polymerase sigma factor (sigma-70 family)
VGNIMSLELTDRCDRVAESDFQLPGAEGFHEETPRDIDAWPDHQLIAAVNNDLPNEKALDALGDRYNKELNGRCEALTYNSYKASDIAQGAWYRALRARRSLQPDGNFPAYLMTIATNLWRDSFRSAQRAGPLSEGRLASLDAEITHEDGDAGALADLVMDPSTLHLEETILLRLDIKWALSRLPRVLRDVLVARFFFGETCAEIGRRYHRTEQTVSAWVRQGIQQMKSHLEGSGHHTVEMGMPR